MQTLLPPYLRSSASVLLALGMASTASAQQSHGGEPAAFRHQFQSPAPVHEVAAPNVAAYMAEDEARDHTPLRYGALIDMDLTLADGQWTDLPDGSRAWRMTITSPGAKSLAVEFDQFHLPAGAEMFVYNELAEPFLGAYNIENEHLDGGFVFEPLRGNSLTLEIDVPVGVADPFIDTAALIYDYRDVFGLMEGTSLLHPGQVDPGACLIDVNCPQGDGWELQKRATVRTLSGGALCSGALINNTANDFTRYLLTANHCGQSSNTIFRFRYQRSGCGSGSSPTTFSVSGATNLTTNSTYDNRLMRINATIPESYNAYFAGWTRSTTAPSMAFAMGHPSGGPKKISIDANGANRESQMWRVTWSEGTLEGGSSGGPLFDNQGRVRGPACCVNNFTCNQTAYFGRFDQFWNANNLDQWLDPLGTGQTALDGIDPQDPCQAPTTYCAFLPNSIGPGAEIGFGGTASISENNLSLSCNGLPPNAVGIFFYADNESASLFGEGLLCASGGVTRLTIQNAGVLGSITNNLDLGAAPFNGGSGQVVSGTIKKFQFWYRDVAGGNAGFNTSDGLSVPFCD